MKRLIFLFIVLLLIGYQSISQSYYKIKISKDKVKLFRQDKTKEIYEIDSMSIHPTGKTFYLSSAEKKVTMEFLQGENLMKLTETFEGKPKFNGINQINLNTVAVIDLYYRKP